MVAGQIVNGTAGGSVDGSAKVTLGVYDRESLQRQVEAQVDAAGSFRFEGLDVGEAVTYQVATSHDQVIYRSEAVRLSADQPERQVTLKVFEPTATDPGLRATQAAIAIEQATDGSRDLLVTESVTLANPSDRAFVPDASSSTEAMSLVRFGLPEGARSFEAQLGLHPDWLILVDQGFASLLPVPPGQQRVQYAYRVPFQAEREVLRKSLPYGAEVLQVIAPEVGLHVTAPELTFEGVRETARGSKVHIWTARNLAAGARLNVGLSGQPARPIWDSLARDPAAPFVLAGLLALAPALGVFWTLRVRRGRPIAGSGQRSSALVASLADLDEAFAAGRIEEPKYRERRRRLRDKLRGQLRAELSLAEPSASVEEVSRG